MKVSFITRLLQLITGHSSSASEPPSPLPSATPIATTPTLTLSPVSKLPEHLSNSTLISKEGLTRVLGTVDGEGFTSVIVQDDDKRVHFSADADIDADGANGQHGKQAAYMVGDKGSELLANGGMKMLNGRVVAAHLWARDIVICDRDGNPKVFPGGIIASKTAYKFHNQRADLPSAYVDSETYPYIVVPPLIRLKAKGVILGAKCRVTNLKNGKVAWGGVCDIGPRNRVGEISMEMARRLGINPSPRDGGMDEPHLLYEIFPDEAADQLTLLAA